MGKRQRLSQRAFDHPLACHNRNQSNQDFLYLGPAERHQTHRRYGFGQRHDSVWGQHTHCPSSICTGISVEHLTLYGNGNSLIGIQNENSQDLSYVDHVTLYHVLGPGLLVSGNAERSGPYTNIQYDTGGSGGSGPVCAQIKGLSSTHGIHGLTLGACPA